MKYEDKTKEQLISEWGQMRQQITELEALENKRPEEQIKASLKEKETMSKAQILVVEDERIIARDIQNQLKKLGYAVPAIASSGKEAIQKTKKASPDLVLMDINLNGDMDGIAAAEQIRIRFNIPVIYLTAYSDEATLQRAKVTEAYSYIIKPFQIQELQINIEIALYKHKVQLGIPS